MISGKRYISSRRAGKEFHYHADYIGQLVRGGKVAGQKVGRAWYVSEASLAAYLRKEASDHRSGGKQKNDIQQDEEDSAYRTHAVRSVDRITRDEASPAPATTAQAGASDQSGASVKEERASMSAAPAKMLKYFSDASAAHAEDADAGIPKLQKKSAASHAAESEYDEDTDETPPFPRRVQSEALWDEEEMPVPVRITAAPALARHYEPARTEPARTTVQSGKPARSGGPEPLPPEHYYREVPMHPYAEHSSRPRFLTARLVLIITTLGLLGLAGGFGVSLMPIAI